MLRTTRVISVAFRDRRIGALRLQRARKSERVTDPPVLWAEELDLEGPAKTTQAKLRRSASTTDLRSLPKASAYLLASQAARASANDSSS